jgi:hypothetical protein
VRAAFLILLTGCGFHVRGSAPSGDARDAPDSPIDAHDGSIDALADAPIDSPVIAADVIIEAEAANMTTSPHEHSWVIRTNIAGHTGTGFMELTGGNGGVCPSGTFTTIATCSAAMFYDLTLPTGGSYTLWLRMWANTSSTDSVFVTVDDPVALSPQQVDVLEDSMWRWSKSAVVSVYTLAPGAHRIGIWHREGGARVDKLALMAGTNPPP